MDRRKNNAFHKDFSWLFFCSLLLLFLVAAVFYKESNPEWKNYQRQFKEYLKNKVSPEAASSFEVSVKQMWLPELNRVDRCISCHVGYDQPNLGTAPAPFTAHADIEPHSFLKMGCTICHGGQGFALKKMEAHGDIEHWDQPLLGKNLARKYGFPDEHVLIQINCNLCHRRDEKTPGMELINLGKKLLTSKKKCQTCHIIENKGGKLGPDLTFIGDKPPERFDFSHIKDRLVQKGRPVSVLNWHFEHFMSPESVVSESKMPPVDYSEKEAWALSMLMMSWKNENLPVLLLPGPKEKKISAAKAETEKMSSVEWGEKLFEEKGCSECHTIGKGVEVGPDLKGVTLKRDHQWLKRMILNPEEMEKTDPLAKKLYQEFDEVGMPADEISEEEAEAIIQYLASFRIEKE